MAVRVRGKGRRNYIDTYALCDSGSNQTYVSRNLADSLSLSRKAMVIDKATISGTQTIEVQLSDILLSNTEDNCTFEASDVIIKPSLNIRLTSRVSQDELSNWQHLKDINVPDVQADDVHILIGQDCADLLKPLEMKAGRAGEPCAVRTAFGRSINGIVNNHMPRTRPSPASYFVRKDQELSAQVERFWHLEDEHTTDLHMSTEDKQAMSVWNASAVKIDNHYTLDIPFKTKSPNLPDNRDVAEHKLRLLAKRLDKNGDLKEKYTKGINELLDKG